jgi:hypothetical protein
MIEQLSELPSTTPDATTRDHVRAKCHAALRQRRRSRVSKLDAMFFLGSAAYLVFAAAQLLIFF